MWNKPFEYLDDPVTSSQIFRNLSRIPFARLVIPLPIQLFPHMQQLQHM
jgi:hypothetical protein